MGKLSKVTDLVKCEVLRKSVVEEYMCSLRNNDKIQYGLLGGRLGRGQHAGACQAAAFHTSMEATSLSQRGRLMLPPPTSEEQTEMRT